MPFGRIVRLDHPEYILDVLNRIYAMRAATDRLTADDVWNLHSERPDVFGYELVNGELVELSPNAARHARILGTAVGAIHAYLGDRGGGRLYAEGGFVLRLAGDPERLRQPDIAYVANETLELAGGEPETGYARFAPDLVVEIDSPSNKDEDVQQRIGDYLDAGVGLVWVIHPRSRTAMVYHPDGSARLLREREALDGENVLPGFTLPLRELLG